MCEVRRHQTAGDCWLVYSGKVVDVSDMVRTHPGGEKAILRHAGGEDCKRDYLFHSPAARKDWRKHIIGRTTACQGCPEYSPPQSSCIVS